ncbi:MAG TPA: chromate transporter [Candidatus Limnocylindria bacterium]|jgi:chromate transporter|nr:chromate transporter [Candidatus Limnocylindria bacterium]
MEQIELFLVFLRAAALSVGGMAALPQLRQDLVSTGLVTERQILEALAIGKLTPGPTGLYVVSLGYFAAGAVGAVLALIAAAIPPLSMVAVAGIVRRQLLSPWAAGVVRGVVLSTSGLVVATSITLLAPDRAVLGVPPWQLLLALAAAVLAINGRTHPGVVIVGGAVVGIAFGR